MIIEQDRVVSFHFVLKATTGQLLESSRDGNPVTYVQGAPGMLPGLVDAFEGKQAGDQFQLTLPPAKAFGERLDNQQTRVPIKHLKTKQGKLIKGKLAPGTQVLLHAKDGVR